MFWVMWLVTASSMHEPTAAKVIHQRYWLQCGGRAGSAAVSAAFERGAA